MQPWQKRCIDPNARCCTDATKRGKVKFKIEIQELDRTKLALHSCRGRDMPRALPEPFTSFAQNEEDHQFTLSVGGGLTIITGRCAGKLDHGGNLQAGAGYFFSRYVGVTGQFMLQPTRHHRP